MEEEEIPSSKSRLTALPLRCTVLSSSAHIKLRAIWKKGIESLL
jgi:hypothetical protein